MTWDEWYMDVAHVVATKSKDPSTKMGCVIVDADHRVVAVGYNGAPRGVTEVDTRPEKYYVYEHAERNAIYNARCDLRGCTLYVLMLPCADCARGVIQVGIREVIVPTMDVPDRWMESAEWGLRMFNQAGIKVRSVQHAN